MRRYPQQGALFWLAAACALPLCAAPASSSDLAAIVSSDSGPYAEACAAFMAALPEKPDLYNAASPDFSAPDDPHYLAAFGARAAALELPRGTHKVYALAPVAARGPGWHEISMVPPPTAALTAYRDLQPGLKRLAVFWSAYPGEKYLAELHAAGKEAGIEIISVRLKSPDSLPERLRRLMGKMDAFWLMPDPALITPASLLVLANFSCANAVPFYAPTYALALNGATASYAPEFAEAGAAAARALLLIKSGGSVPSVVYPENIKLRVNEPQAEKCRWPIRRK